MDSNEVSSATASNSPAPSVLPSQSQAHTSATENPDSKPHQAHFIAPADPKVEVRDFAHGIKSDHVVEAYTNSEQPLTKRQLRKLRKRQLWLATKPDRRARAKESVKRRKAEAVAKVDMAYDSLMSNKDLHQCVHQLNFCYGVNRRVPQPTQFYIANFAHQSRQIFNAVPDRANWDVHLKEESIDVLFDQSEIVYLSSDSDNVLSDLEDSKVYVIGGLVDHNQHKGVCHQRAVDAGWSHARLPIDEFVNMKTRQVLTVNQVFHILTAYVEKRSWEQAFYTAIPVRKGLKPKENDPKHTTDSTIKTEELKQTAESTIKMEESEPKTSSTSKTEELEQSQVSTANPAPETSKDSMPSAASNGDSVKSETLDAIPKSEPVNASN